jgi:hypothetical protein
MICVPSFHYGQTSSGDCGNNYNSNGRASKMSIMSMDCTVWEKKKLKIYTIKYWCRHLQHIIIDFKPLAHLSVAPMTKS